MKENSIEDRIEEKYTNYLNCETDELDLNIEESIFILEKDKKEHFMDDLLEEAYKVILSDYKRVLKENEEYLKQLDLDYVDNNYIPKSKVKEKIEELHNKYIKILNDYGNTSTDIIINVVSKEARKDLDEIVNQIQILQELLE